MATTLELGAGRVRLQFYGSLGPGTGSPIQGTSIEALTQAERFPDSPDIVSGESLAGSPFPFLTNGLQWPVEFSQGNFNEQYGTMAEGYIYVPESGGWKFFVRSDDASRFELNPSGRDPSAREVIAEEPNCCNAFVDDGTRSSDRLSLEAGTAYYFRILHKEGSGNDWWQVGWDGPSIDGPVTIDSRYVQEFAQEGAPEVTSPLTSVTVTERQDARFEVGVRAAPPADFIWSVEGDTIEGANTPFLTLADVSLDQEGSTVRVEVSNEEGSASAETTLSVQPDTTAPFVRRVDPRGNPNGVVVFYSEAVSEATALESGHYQIDGGDIGVASVELLNESTVRVNTPGEGFAELSSHSIEIRDIEDTASEPNVIEPNPTTREFQFGGGGAGFYPDTVKSDDAVRYWRLGEQSGSTAFTEVSGDDALSDGHGTYSGGPTLGADGLVPSLPDNTAVAFEPGEHVDIPNGNDINVGGPYLEKSVELWIKPEEILGADQAQGLWEQGGGVRGLGMYLIEDQIFMNAWNNADDGEGAPWGSGTDGQDPVFVGGGEITPGEVIHVVGVLDGVAGNDLTGALRLYINGQLVDETGGAGQLYNHGGDVDIAEVADRLHTDADGGNLHGTIDDISLYNTALSTEQVQAHFEAGNLRSEVGPIELTKGPEDKSVEEGDNVVFTAEATGARPHRFQWLVNGQPVEGATERSFRLELVTEKMDGNAISVQVRNGFSETTSAEVTLSVRPDRTPPSVTRLEGLTGKDDRIRIVFDEALDESSATDLANYSAEGLSLEEVTLSEDGREVTLTTGEQTIGEQYSLRIEGLDDIAPATNLLNTQLSFMPQLGGFDPTLTYVAQPLPEAPTIDGSIETEVWQWAGGSQAGGESSDWRIGFNPNAMDSLIGGVGGEPTGGEDINIEIYGGYTDQDLYVAVRVQDNNLVGDTAEAESRNQQTWMDDSVEVFVDGDNSNLSSRSPTSPEVVDSGGQYVITINNAFRESEAGNPGYGPDQPWHALTEVDEEAGVYEAEFRIAMDEIGNPEPGGIVGFTVSVNDDDGEEGRTQHRWIGEPHTEVTYGNLVLGPRRYIAPAIASPPSVDGRVDLGEYGSAASVSVNPHTGMYTIGDNDWEEGDHAFSYQIVHDPENIYVGVEVIDDQVKTDTTQAGSADGRTWLDDGVEVFLDADNSDDTIAFQEAEHGANEFEGQYVMTAHGARRDNEANNPSFGEEAQWFAASSTTESGYGVEYRVAKEGLMDAAEGDTLGFDLDINDDDETVFDREPKTQLHWDGRPHLESSYGDLVLSALETSGLARLPGINISLEEGNVTVEFGEEATLQTAPTLSGPWEASDQESPATFPVEESEARFFRAVR